jgi:hypothetical protein
LGREIGVGTSFSNREIGEIGEFKMYLKKGLGEM